MASLYWANLPYELETGIHKLRIPVEITLRALELLAAQIFGMLLYMVSISLRDIFHTNVPVIYQLVCNYVVYKIIDVAVSKFEITPLPVFTNKRHESLVRTLLIPSGGIVLVFAGAGMVLLVAEQWSSGLTVRWLPFIYALLANSLLLLFVDQIVRVGKTKTMLMPRLLLTVLLGVSTIITIGAFYIRH